MINHRLNEIADSSYQAQKIVQMRSDPELGLK